MGKITHIISDLGGVFLDCNDTLERLAVRIGLPYDRFADFYTANINAPLCDGSLSEMDAWKRVNEHFGTHVSSPLLSEVFQSKVYAPIYDLYVRLKAKGLRLVVLSNTYAGHWDKSVEGNDLAIFDAWYASHLIGMHKPDREIFTYVLDKEGIRPDAAVFIDDNAENVRSANTLGFHAWQYQIPEDRKAVLLEKFIQGLLD